VRWHLTALGLEKKSHQLKEDPKAEERYLRYWKGAIRLWDEVLGNDVTWSALSARALALDDARVSLEFIQELRRLTAEAFVSINASLVAKFAKDGRADLAKIQIVMVCTEDLKTLSSWKFTNAAITQLKGGLRAFLRANDPGTEGHEASGADIASTLIGILPAYHSSFEALAYYAALHAINNLRIGMRKMSLGATPSISHQQGQPIRRCVRR